MEKLIRIKESLYIRSKLKDYTRFRKVLSIIKPRMEEFYTVDEIYLDFVTLPNFETILERTLRSVDLSKGSPEEIVLIEFLLKDVNSISDISKLLLAIIVSLLFPKKLVEMYV